MEERKRDVALDQNKLNYFYSSNHRCALSDSSATIIWEKMESGFRKTGGYAYIALLLNQLKRKKKSNTYIIDTR
jgi:hypothetical protein